MAVRFQNFTAASRKPNIHLFHLLPETDDLSWIEAAAPAPTFETPTGPTGSSNQIFTMSTPGGFVAVYVNGLYQTDGVAYTYNSGLGTINFIGASIPAPGAYVRVIQWGADIDSSVYGGVLPPVIEVPSGTMNGTNVTFTVTAIPTTFILFYNGVCLKLNVGYTRTTTTITMTDAPVSGDSLVAVYWR